MERLWRISEVARWLGTTHADVCRFLPDAPPGVVLHVGEYTRIDFAKLEAWLRQCSEPRPSSPPHPTGGGGA